MARVSDFDVENINEIMDGHGDWFSAQLLRLCQKADQHTLAQIRLGFPDHVLLFEGWRDSEYAVVRDTGSSV